MGEKVKTWHYYMRTIGFILGIQLLVTLPFKTFLRESSAFVSLFIVYGFLIGLGLILFLNHKRDHNTLAYLGFQDKMMPFHYLLGILFGGSMILLIFWFLLKSGLYQTALSPTARWDFIVLLLIGFVIQSLAEEVIIRAYLFKGLLQTISFPKALLFQAVIFAFFHSLNPNFSYIAGINIFIFGLIAGIVYYRSQNIYTVAGLHLMWNFMQGVVLGINVSGMNIVTTIYKSSPLRNDAITGGSFGLEGSVITTFVLLFVLAILYINNLKGSINSIRTRG